VLHRALPLVALVTFARAGQDFAWDKLPPLPEALGVAGAYAGVSGDTLLVAGGANFPDKMPWAGGSKVWHDRIWALSRREGPWQEVGQLPRSLAYGVSGTWRGKMICAGGSDQAGHYADVFSVSMKDGKLAVGRLPALPHALSASCGAVIADTLYVVGGARAPGEISAENKAYALDLAASAPSWRELPPLPGRGRMLSVAAAWQDSLYVVGGAALERDPGGKVGRVYLRECWRYTGSAWQRLADLPKPIAAAPSPAPCFDGQIFILAGDDGSLREFEPERHPGFTPTILTYDIPQDRWSDGGKAPAPRATTPVVHWQNVFVIPSGEVRPGVRSPEIWSLSIR
jgi:N-acetylneuraminic acid mutarotase